MAHFQVYHEHWRYYTCYVSTIQLQFQYLISQVCVPLITATIRACHPSLCMCSKSTPDPLYSSIKPVCLRNISTANYTTQPLVHQEASQLYWYKPHIKHRPWYSVSVFHAEAKVFQYKS